MRKNGWILRGLLMLSSIALLVLALVFPQTVAEVVNWNDDGLKTESIVPGDVLVQPLTAQSTFNQVGVRVEAVREAKGLTLDMTLESGETTVAQQAFSLQKVKAKGRVILEFPAAQAGDYVLTIIVQGEGNTKLGAGEAQPMQLNDQEQAVGCALRINTVTMEYNEVIFFCAALLLLLAVVPAGAREVKDHA